MDMKTTSEYMALLRKYMVENVCVELQTPSMFCLVHIKDELQHLFGCAVDIVRLREDMDKLLKQNIMEEGIYA